MDAIANINGRDSVFSVRLSLWHQKGRILPGYLTDLDEILEESNTNYTYRKEPVTLANYPGMNVPGAWAISMRDEDGRIVKILDGTVGKQYEPHQNREILEPISPLIEEGYLRCEVAGSLFGGSDVWYLFSVNTEIKEFDRLGVKTYILYSDNKDGRRRFSVYTTTIRVVCANTHRLASSMRTNADTFFLGRHTKTLRERAQEFSEKFYGEIIANYATVAEKYAALKARRLRDEEFVKLVLDELAPIPTDKQAPRYDIVLDRAKTKRAELTEAWEYGTGHTGDFSAWEAFNGVTELLDHTDTLVKVRGSILDAEMSGQIGKMKDRVFANLLTTI